MSYNITLKSDGGTVTVDSTSGTIPDGLFRLWGHSDGVTTESLGVQRSTPDNIPAGNVSGSFPVKAG